MSVRPVDLQSLLSGIAEAPALAFGKNEVEGE